MGASELVIWVVTTTIIAVVTLLWYVRFHSQSKRVKLVLEDVLGRMGVRVEHDPLSGYVGVGRHGGRAVHVELMDALPHVIITTRHAALESGAAWSYLASLPDEAAWGAPFFGEQTALTMSWGERRGRSVAAASLARLYGGEVFEELRLLDAPEDVQVQRVSLERGWLSVTRRVMVQDAALERGEELVKQLERLIWQQWRALERVASVKVREEEAWEAVWRGGVSGSMDRDSALRIMLGVFGETACGKRAWADVMREGDVYEVLLAVNEHQERALRDLSDARLVAFMNAAVSLSDVDTRPMPEIMARRLPVSVLYDAHLAWSVRISLLRIWSEDPNQDQGVLQRAIAQMSRQQGAPLLEIQALLSGSRLHGALTLSQDGMAGALSEA